ncbi:TPA: LOW QUALITY PROTEIN: hypothetical protein N0F65_002554, partial [Lagenidium giganteum]
HLVFFRDGKDAEDVIERGKTGYTTLLAWLEANKKYMYPDARTIPYIEFTFKTNEWCPRKQNVSALRKIACVSPRDHERFCLRMLLHKVVGAQSFADIRTVNGQVLLRFQAAAKALRLLEDDKKVTVCLVTANQATLFSKLSEDFQHQHEQETHSEGYTQATYDKSLRHIQGLLQAQGPSLQAFGLPEPLPTTEGQCEPAVIRDELACNDAVKQVDVQSTIPDEYCCKTESLHERIQDVNGNVPTQVRDASYLIETSILCPRNVDVDAVNDAVLDLLDTSKRVYESTDTPHHRSAPMTIASDVLHSLDMSEMPLHRLRLRLGAVVILIRTLSPQLCDGTRRYHLSAQIGAGDVARQTVYLPRIPFVSSDDVFQFRGCPFPIRVAFAMTINKRQGQSMKNVGIYLPQDMFAHGQLYVAFTRIEEHTNVKVLADAGVYVRNVVYPEVSDEF